MVERGSIPASPHFKEEVLKKNLFHDSIFFSFYIFIIGWLSIIFPFLGGQYMTYVFSFVLFVKGFGYS